MCVEIAERSLEKAVGFKSPARMRVGVAGLGLIGAGAALRLQDEADRFDFVAALVRDPSLDRPEIPDGVIVTDDIDAFLEVSPDLLIDALPVGEVGAALIEKALAQGISVVSANKQAIAGSALSFHRSADASQASFAYSAAVGGGAPMVETVRAAKTKGEIVQIRAILNGTVNYILSALARGESFEHAVKAAQDAGFAEPDPTADLSGDDARAKISILSYEAFGEEIDAAEIQTEALTSKRAQEITEAGGAWRQISTVARSDDGKISAGLSFESVPDDSLFAGVTQEGNAIEIAIGDGSVQTCVGKGAGRAPTVGSLFSDLYAILASRNAPTPG